VLSQCVVASCLQGVVHGSTRGQEKGHCEERKRRSSLDLSCCAACVFSVDKSHMTPPNLLQPNQTPHPTGLWPATLPTLRGGGIKKAASLMPYPSPVGRVGLSGTKTGVGYSRNDSSFSRRGKRPSLCKLFARKQRAQGTPGGRCTRSLACKIKKHTSFSHHRFTETIRRSLRNGFNGFLRALPGEPGLLPPSSARCDEHRRQFDASVGASGPHGFAVRVDVARPAAPSTSIASRTKRS
jgi:hypothetical protein